MTPDDLVEIEKIKQLKAKYCLLMDQKRWDEMAEQVFCDDVVIDTTEEGSGIIHGCAPYLEFLVPILADVSTCHHVHAPIITRTGPDTAEGIWSMEDMLRWPDGSPIEKLWGLGWYEEQYRREADGEWRIAHMKLRRIRVELDGKPAGDGDRPASGGRSNQPA